MSARCAVANRQVTAVCWTLMRRPADTQLSSVLVKAVPMLCRDRDLARTDQLERLAPSKAPPRSSHRIPVPPRALPSGGLG